MDEKLNLIEYKSFIGELNAKIAPVKADSTYQLILKGKETWVAPMQFLIILTYGNLFSKDNEKF
jgi:hypothetical protein